MPATYVERFEKDPGGWIGWASNELGPKALEHHSGGVTSRSPWWIDYNHAPPGAGYLHILAALGTAGPGIPERFQELGGHNRFIRESFTTDFRDAELTFSLSGELETRGAQPILLVQASVDRRVSSWALTAQPLTVGLEPRRQTLRCVADPSQWTSLGARVGREDMYAPAALERVLSDVNCNILLILFPLTVEPMGPIPGDRHRLRAGKDYPVWASRLPEGYVNLHEVEIRFREHR